MEMSEFPMIPESFLQRLNNYRSVIDNKLLSILDNHEPAYLYDPVRYVFSGKGKRLRPILVLLVAKSFGTPQKTAMPAALSVEILHNFSLVHDDIMDRDEVRHGHPTVHLKWDESAAILAGDVLFALAHMEMTKLGKYSLDCIRIFNEATIKLCEGQALDKTFEEINVVSLDEYLNMVSLKTGALISLCCQIGGIVGNTTSEKIAELSNFGKFIGQAFQIQDDLLEIFSTSKKMGKSLGSDVLTSKKTYLTCKAIKSNHSAWNQLMEEVSGQNMEQDVLPKLRRYYTDTGIAGSAKKDINKLVSQAKLCLENINSDGNDLLHFVNLIMSRKN